jgi:hypothetical protein
VHSQAFHASHDAHSTRMVNDRLQAAMIYGFEMVDGERRGLFAR